MAYYVLARQLVNHHNKDSKLSKAIGAEFKGLLSISLYAFAIFVAFINPFIAKGIYVLVAIIWFAPDTLIERALRGKD